MFTGIPALAQTPQTPPPAAQEPPATQAPAETRPATTTYWGDTGLWFVPTGEILPNKRWSFSLYRTNFDFEQGFTDVSVWPITFGYGLSDRAEVFAAIRAVTRIDRDTRPIFFPNGGGLVNEYPFVREGWSGNDFGDLFIGAKINLLSQHRQQPVALALRGTLKLPTGSDDEGAGTGETDWYFDFMVSKELNERVELSAFGGFARRGDPDNISLTDGFRWGFGAGLPDAQEPAADGGAARRVLLRRHGDGHRGAVDGRGRVAVAGRVGDFGAGECVDRPDVAKLEGLFRGWRPESGTSTWTAGASLAVSRTRRAIRWAFSSGSGITRACGSTCRRRPPAPEPPPAAPVNRPPTVKAACDPCTVEVGRTSSIRATASDPDGDPLTYRWSCVTGTIANPTAPTTPWTAPMQPGPVPCTVTVDDGKGGTASDTVTIQVVRPAVKEFVFEDVHFDFDRYTLRPEATRVLDEAIKAMSENPELRLELEGHTCNIGTAEYNLALGERRAQAVRDYLQSRGVGTDRLRTVSYGEERPKHDNAREETRRLNRRAAMVVRLQR